jgi:putative NADH-flavin reductase
MQLLVLGATGATGQQIVEQALFAQHRVTAYVRSPEKLQGRTGLAIVQGSIDDTKALADVLEGHDAVLSALGGGGSLREARKSTVIEPAIMALLPAMHAADVERVIFCSAMGVGETFDQASAVMRLIYRRLLGPIYADKARGEAILRASQVAWTLVYPTILTNAPRTAKYQVGEHLRPKSFAKISRADVADFMLKQLDDGTWIRRGPIITN